MAFKLPLKDLSDGLENPDYLQVSEAGKLQLSVAGGNPTDVTGDSVKSVTGPAVDDTDPKNPVVSKQATTSAPGLMPALSFASMVAIDVPMGDANTTWAPATNKRSLCVVPTGVCSADRTLTVDVNGMPDASKPSCVYVVIQPQAHTVTVKNVSGVTLFTAAPSSQAVFMQLYYSSGDFVFSFQMYTNN